MNQHEVFAQSASAYADYLARAQRRHGEQFDPAELNGTFARYFHGPRIQVTTTYGDGSTFVRTGTVSVTSGHRPVLLLVHRSNSDGSWDTLSTRSHNEITGVQWTRGGKYYPAPAQRIPATAI